MIQKAALILAQLVVGVLLIGLLLWWLQPRMVFFPFAQLQSSPIDWGLDYEEVTLVTEDGVKLHGWLIAAPAKRPQPPGTLLFFHGNAGNISHRGDSITIFTALGLDVLIIDYRGYGRSEGKPTERGLYADAEAAWRWLTQTRGIPPGDIIIFGRSLGGAVATQLASQTQPGALIVESGFDRLQSLAEAHYPLLSRLVPLRYRFSAVDLIGAVRCPVLVLHSPEDQIVPFNLGERLYEAAPGPKAFVELRGGHNEGFLSSQPRYQEALDSFLAQLPRARSPE
jgi:fermentation-respiration switch protein FrsA (DUF1100 family)